MTEQEQAGGGTASERARKRTERQWNFGILGGFLAVFLIWGTAGAAFAVMGLIVLCLLVLLVRVLSMAAKRRAGRGGPVTR